MRISEIWPKDRYVPTAETKLYFLSGILSLGDSMKVVVKLGGFVFPTEPDCRRIQAYADVMGRLSEQGYRLVVVTGGGGDARKYISVARELGASEYVCDLLGIKVSQMNAYLFISALGDHAYPAPPTSLNLLQAAFELGKIVVTGGMHPAQSTNAVAALAAEAVQADLLINATDIDGVYTSDPKRDPTAKRLATIETHELVKMVLNGSMEAGTYELFDAVAIKVVERSHMKTRIVDGRVPENIEKAVRGDPIGTLVLVSGRRGT